MSMAIKYRMQKRAGGERCNEHGLEMCEMCHGGKMADGGEVEPPPPPPDMLDRKQRIADSMKKAFGYADGGLSKEQEMPEDDGDLVSEIMRKRSGRYSRGGQVANDTPVTADFEDNQFDDLVKRDDLEMSYTGANSGDELGSEQEDDDRRDIVRKIMKQRSMKDRMPRMA